MISGISSRLMWLVLLTPLWSMASSVSELKVEPRVWLDKMSHSQRELSYQGTFTYEQAGSIKAMRIAHAVVNGEEFERLEHLDGKENRVIRRGHGPDCIHSGDTLLRLYKKQSNLKGAVDHFYDFSVVGRSRVAGRSVVELAVMPRDKHRFGHRLSLDESTGLLLRSIRYGTNNQVLERFQFVELSLGGELPEALFSGPLSSQSLSNHRVQHIDPTIDRSAKVATWKIDWLPGGFKYAPKSLAVNSLEMMTFTDGLTAFSVFVEPHQQKDVSSGIQGRAQRGATMAYSRAILLGGTSFRVTVVGEIPHLTAERIAASVVPAS